MSQIILQLIKEWRAYAAANGGETVSFTRGMLLCADQLTEGILGEIDLGGAVNLPYAAEKHVG